MNTITLKRNVEPSDELLLRTQFRVFPEQIQDYLLENGLTPTNLIRPLNSIGPQTDPSDYDYHLSNLFLLCMDGPTQERVADYLNIAMDILE